MLAGNFLIANSAIATESVKQTVSSKPFKARNHYLSIGTGIYKPGSTQFTYQEYDSYTGYTDHDITFGDKTFNVLDLEYQYILFNFMSIEAEVFRAENDYVIESQNISGNVITKTAMAKLKFYYSVTKWFKPYYVAVQVGFTVLDFINADLDSTYISVGPSVGADFRFSDHFGMHVKFRAILNDPLGSTTVSENTVYSLTSGVDVYF